MFNIDLSLDQLASTVAQPNPDEPTEGNRKIVLRHAQGFAKYLRDRIDGVIPPLLLRAPEDTFEFTAFKTIGGTDWGVLAVPRLARNDLNIVDGQHRILGIHLLIKELADELATVRSERAAALKEDNVSVVAQMDGKIEELEAHRSRLNGERVSAQIVVVDDAREYRQIFVDIAENAKGITQAVKSRFDSTRVVNRCLEDVMEHKLIAGRVDLHRDRIQGDNPNLLGAKHVADIIRTLQVGVGGRISTRLESELREEELIAEADSFLSLLCRAFGDLNDVSRGNLAPPDLRKRSLLGSVTMLRVLAGVYRELITRAKNEGSPEELEADKERVTGFFRALSRHTETPILAASPWLKSRAFQEGATAPRAGMGDMRNLTTLIVAWAKVEPRWLRGQGTGARR